MPYQRSRSLSKREQSYMSHRIQKGSIDSTTLHPTSTTGYNRDIQDWVTPNFRILQEAGIIVSSPYASSVQSRVFLPSAINWTSASWNRSISGDGFPVLRPIARANYPALSATEQKIYSDQARNSAIIEAYAEMNGSTVGGGEILAEMAQTIQMVRQPLNLAYTRIRKFFTKVQKAKRSCRSAAAANDPALLANIWLQYAYGWQPLVSDVAKLANAYQEGLSKLEKQWHVVRGGGTRVWTKSLDFSGYTSTGLLAGFTSKCTLETEWSWKCRAGIKFVFLRNDPEDLIVTRTLGLSAHSLVPTVWNLVPYSFVVDWTVDVGSWLTAINQNPYCFLVESWVVTNSREYNSGDGTASGRFDPGDGSGVRTYSGYSGGETISTRRILRELSPNLPGSPVANLDFNSLRRSISGLSLILQRIGDFNRQLKS